MTDLKLSAEPVHLSLSDLNGRVRGWNTGEGTGYFLLSDLLFSDGWVLASETWTRTGNYTFTVSGDVTAQYRKGTKVRYKDGGAYEYGVIISSSYGAPNTTVTLATNSDYAMAAATITDTYLSYVDNPEGYPDWFNYAITWAASGSMTYTSVTTAYAKFRVSGKTVTAIAASSAGTTGGTASNTLNGTLPINALLAANNQVGSAYVGDNAASVVGFCFIGSTNLVNCRKYDLTNFGLGTNRQAAFQVTYEMA